MDRLGTETGAVKPPTDPSSGTPATGEPAAAAAGPSPGHVRQLGHERASYAPRLRIGGVLLERPTPRKPLLSAAAVGPPTSTSTSVVCVGRPESDKRAEPHAFPGPPADAPNARANRKSAETQAENGRSSELGSAPHPNDRALLFEPAPPELQLERDAGTPAEWARWLAAAWRASRLPHEWRPDGSDAPQPGQAPPWTVLEVDGFAVEWVTDEGPEARPPSLDTSGIGQQVLASTRLSPAAIGRAVELAERTAAHRDWLASHHTQVAAGLKLTDPGRTWHLARAKGWKERWGRVVQCGASFAVKPECKPCGKRDEDGERPITCDTRECSQCRSEHLRQLRARLHKLCELAEEARAFECAATHNGPGAPLGQWRWRFVTLTIPPGRGVGADAAQVRDAWACVWRKYVEHCRREGKERRSPFAWSSVEATTGETREGHVHLHALVLGPYMAEALIRRWWGEALAAGRAMPYRDAGEVADFCEAGAFGNIVAPLATMTRRGRNGRWVGQVAWPVVNVQAVSTIGEAVTEVAKYAVKDGWAEYDSEAQLDRLADLYCALARVRLYSCSRWIAEHVPAAPAFRHDLECKACGAVGEWDPAIRPRGPPGYVPRGYRCAAVTAATLTAPSA